MVKKALFLSSFGRTGKRKKPSLRVMENVGSPASVGNVPIEVNIYGGTFLLYKVVSCIAGKRAGAAHSGCGSKWVGPVWPIFFRVSF